ncbi:hypothetical protein [Paraburkholderia sp. RL17-347-BIC-D]|uniref:hypothetical protein n=1 Tax=Paraburkholderia sp. RL17-347-BIC-D TaxID=3031632 RepID=UPI0038B860B1
MFPLTSAVVTRGQRAWGRIKATAAEQRQLWKEVGEALMVGRSEHPTDNNKFGEWCAANGFGDVERHDRADAMWLAENWWGLGDCPPTLSHPHAVRRWMRKQQADTPPSPEVDLSTSPAPRQRISIETAKKVNKLASMAESGEGQEQQTAKKYLKKQAELFT